MFSVIIPYYKKRNYIQRCLDSVLSQTFQDFEIILVDDGSQDDIAELIVTKYAGKLKLIQQQNQGVSVARNRGISESTMNYIALLDADDCWHHRYLEYCYEVIKQNSNVKIIGTSYLSDIELLDEKVENLHYYKIKNYFSTKHIRNLIFLTSATILKKDFFKQNTGFNPKFKRGEDIDVWFRVMISEGQAFHIVNKLVYYSNEDMDQLTRQITPIEVSVLSSMFDLYKPLFIKYRNESFEKFINKWTLFQLIKYYDNINWEGAKITFDSRTRSLILYDFPFMFPLAILKTEIFKKIVKNYFKILIKFGL